MKKMTKDFGIFYHMLINPSILRFAGRLSSAVKSLSPVITSGVMVRPLQTQIVNPTLTALPSNLDTMLFIPIARFLNLNHQYL